MMTLHHGAWLSLVERSVRDREVVGSNPIAPTIFQEKGESGMCSRLSLFEGSLALFWQTKTRTNGLLESGYLARLSVRVERAVFVRALDSQRHRFDECSSNLANRATPRANVEPRRCSLSLLEARHFRL